MKQSSSDGAPLHAPSLRLSTCPVIASAAKQSFWTGQGTFHLDRLLPLRYAPGRSDACFGVVCHHSTPVIVTVHMPRHYEEANEKQITALNTIADEVICLIRGNTTPVIATPQCPVIANAVKQSVLDGAGYLPLG